MGAPGCVLLWAPRCQRETAILERSPAPVPPSARPLSVGLPPLVSWSHQPPERAGRSCAGPEQHQHQHPASHPCCGCLGRVLGARPGSSCPGRDGPGQLLLWLQVGSPWGSGTRGHGRAPQQQPFSCPPLSALQGGSQRGRGGAERGRAAEPGPPEEPEAPSPPPAGAGHGQVAVRACEPSCLCPSPGPGSGAGTPWH